jgi:hypothetical protein
VKWEEIPEELRGVAKARAARFTSIGCSALILLALGGVGAIVVWLWRLALSA